MAKRPTDSNRRNSGRRNFAAWLMTLLPGFMFLGLLAPAAVSVKPKAEESYPVSFRSFAPRRPLQVPLHLVRAVFEGNVTDTAVFSGARYLVEQSKRVFEVDAKQPNHDNQIVLASNDGAEDYVDETVFSAAGDEVQLNVDLVPVWDPAIFDIIPGLVARDGWNQWDEFHGVAPIEGQRRPAVVPEPTTGALLTLGLGALALRRRAA